MGPGERGGGVDQPLHGEGWRLASGEDGGLEVGGEEGGGGEAQEVAGLGRGRDDAGLAAQLTRRPAWKRSRNERLPRGDAVLPSVRRCR